MAQSGDLETTVGLPFIRRISPQRRNNKRKTQDKCLYRFMDTVLNRFKQNEKCVKPSPQILDRLCTISTCLTMPLILSYFRLVSLWLKEIRTALQLSQMSVNTTAPVRLMTPVLCWELTRRSVSSPHLAFYVW